MKEGKEGGIEDRVIWVKYFRGRERRRKGVSKREPRYVGHVLLYNACIPTGYCSKILCTVFLAAQDACFALKIVHKSCASYDL